MNIDEGLDKLKEELNNVKFKLSELRRTGNDTKIAELKLMNIPAKIMVAEATRDMKDVTRVNEYFEEVNEELSEIKASQVIKEDENKQKKVQDNEEIKKINKKSFDYSETEAGRRTKKLIQEAHKGIDEKDYKKTYQNYMEIRDMYKYLPKDLKKPVYSEVIDIYKKIIKIK